MRIIGGVRRYVAVVFAIDDVVGSVVALLELPIVSVLLSIESGGTHHACRHIGGRNVTSAIAVALERVPVRRLIGAGFGKFFSGDLRELIDIGILIQPAFSIAVGIPSLVVLNHESAGGTIVSVGPYPVVALRMSAGCQRPVAVVGIVGTESTLVAIGAAVLAFPNEVLSSGHILEGYLAFVSFYQELGTGAVVLTGVADAEVVAAIHIQGELRTVFLYVGDGIGLTGFNANIGVILHGEFLVDEYFILAAAVVVVVFTGSLGTVSPVVNLITLCGLCLIPLRFAADDDEVSLT